MVTALAIVAHEIPQEAGDYIVLLNAGFSRRKALLYNALVGLAAVAGGVLGYFLVGPWEAALPYLLVAASSSFIYVAVADLLPQLQQRLSWRETLAQVAWLGAGLGLVLLARGTARKPRALRSPPAAVQRPRAPAVQRTTSTGSVLCVSTFCVSLPSSSALTPRRPCEAITMRSQPCALAWSRIASQGCSASTVWPWQVTPAARPHRWRP